MERAGVVIFNNDLSAEGFAALEWASSVLPKLAGKRKVYILLIAVEKGKDTKMEIDNGDKEINLETFAARMDNEEAVDLFDKCKNKFGDKSVPVMTFCSGANIQEILQKAIKELNLDMLILGTAALGKKGPINLQLDSKCSVVLVKIDHKLVKTTFEEIPQTNEEDGNPSDEPNRQNPKKEPKGVGKTKK